MAVVDMSVHDMRMLSRAKADRGRDRAFHVVYAFDHEKDSLALRMGYDDAGKLRALDEAIVELQSARALLLASKDAKDESAARGASNG